jgi:glycosyltransferase involved in cell wall biosynthesis
MTPKNQKKLARDIAEYINLLLGNKELRKQMSILCRQRAENYFSWKATATGTIDVYHELFNENKMEVICG